MGPAIIVTPNKSAVDVPSLTNFYLACDIQDCDRFLQNVQNKDKSTFFFTSTLSRYFALQVILLKRKKEMSLSLRTQNFRSKLLLASGGTSGEHFTEYRAVLYSCLSISSRTGMRTVLYGVS